MNPGGKLYRQEAVSFELVSLETLGVLCCVGSNLLTTDRKDATKDAREANRSAGDANDTRTTYMVARHAT